MTALAVRSGPGDANGQTGSLSSGQTVGIHCYVAGQSVSGPYGTEDLWDALDTGGYIPDAELYTGSNGATVPACPSAQFGTGTYPVAWTGASGYSPRTAQSLNSASTGAVLPTGLLVAITCETTGQALTDSAGYTSSRWDALAGGGWIPNVYLDTQVNGATPGVTTCSSADRAVTGGGAPPATGGGSSSTQTAHNTDPCLAEFQPGTITTHSIFGGSETNYDRTASALQACEGWGLSDASISAWELACVTIGVVVGVVGKKNLKLKRADKACDYLGIASDANAAQYFATFKDQLCGPIADEIGTTVGVFAAGATAESGPVAVAIGVATYKLLSTEINLYCSGDLAKVHQLGVYIETKHEAQVRADIVNKGECLELVKVFGVLDWRAVRCTS
ncbi:hypothetical protein I6A62_04830 [Frankia sp. AgW1.1]|nr:hypothetical protein [Frankia sp. AgW1.1]